jgi:predicted nucleic acid-binding protein
VTPASAQAVLFLDTSALVRRYDWNEPGAARVRALCERRSGHRVVISAVTSPEIASAVNRKVREGVFTPSQRDRRWRLFREHRRSQYHEVALDAQIYRMAERLLFTHTLRAYDALQLSAALVTARLLSDIAQFQFCTADRAQGAAASAEGLTVELIA